MYHLLAALAAPLLLLLLAARGTLAENRFRRPPGPGPTGDFRDNPVYALGSQLDLQWETDFESVDLLVWQESDTESEPAYAIIAQKTRSTGMLWTVGYSGFQPYHDPTRSNVYFIQMFKSGDNVGNVTSHYFNITDSSASATPSAASTTTRLLIDATPTASGTPDSSVDSGPSDAGTSRGAVAGIAVGAALGVLGVAAVAGWLFWRRWRGKNAAGAAGGGVGGGPRVLREVAAQDEKGYYGGPVGYQTTYEVDGSVPMYEMPASAQVGHDGNRTL
ncbi:hypothetical protein LZ30DRAFT_778833 [Colletotrichum cereale]|nr:hypothetical protein LZ30DRAFT_778833 [Colletotrichum cereale]